MVPVPAYPPRLDPSVRFWQVLGNIAADCRPKVVLTTRNVASLSAAAPRSRILARSAGFAPTTWIPPRAFVREPRIDPDALALLQYTSGSTATPKGVMVTHRNLMHNQRAIAAAVAPEGPGFGVSWLPLYHDMGLMAGVVHPVFQGIPWC